MDFMAQFTVWLTGNLQYVILTLTALIFIALIVFININMKLARLNRRYQKMMEGTSGANLESILFQHIDTVKDATAKVAALEQESRRLDGRLKYCTQKLGVVRFNAFEDTGSDLSFAVALLDSNDDGVVFSSIYSRSESRVYAKPVTAGQSTYFLTDEEKRALSAARENFSRR
ncbi:MAG TPA: DUF4446 family protein [Negativicutes bacterium]|nr:DUF4446 family protein [Negativicutes bacterium]